MRTSTLIAAASSALLFLAPGCTSPEDDTGSDTGPTDTATGDTADPSQEDTDTAPASDFEAGQYRVSTLELMESGVGFDIDGDGEQDNKLPDILTMVNYFVADIDLSPDGFNATLADSLESGALILLLDARHTGSDLTLDLLLGAEDDVGELSVDEEQSYDEGTGEPYSRLHGAFLDQVAYEAGPDDIQIPITVYPDEPALLVPLVGGLAEGDLEAEATEGMLGGAIPVEDLVDQVVAPIIPEEGYDDRTKEEWLELIESTANDEAVSDLELEDGSRAFSAALAYTAAPAAWTATR